MFAKTIEALKATEAAAQEELDALFVPFDRETGSGGVHWHAAGSGILQNAINGIAGLRAELEKREAPIAEAEAAASGHAKADAVAAAQAQVTAANDALIAAQSMPDDQAPAEEAKETTAEEKAEDTSAEEGADKPAEEKAEVTA